MLKLVLSLLFVSMFALNVNSATFNKRGGDIDIERVFEQILEDQLRFGYFSLHDNHTLISHIQRAACEYKCPNEGKLKQKDGHVATVNGCGSYSISIDFSKVGMDEFNDCCDVHDVCYEECDKTKDNCDNVFYGCLSGHCSRWAAEKNWSSLKKLACDGTAKVVYFAVQSLGCKAYVDSIEKACDCV